MVVASTFVVLDGQRGRSALNDTVKPVDESILTDADIASEAAAKAIWHRRTAYPILGEETGVSRGSGDEGVLGMCDPIDGTRPFLNGAHTSTVMSGAYDLSTSRFIASSIGHPTSGTLVEASNGTTKVSQLSLSEDRGSYELTDRNQAETWDGPLRQSTVLVDNFAPFTRGTAEDPRIITDPARLSRFYAGLLEVEAKPQGYGSNGYHQMLLAKGGKKLGGAIMLAQGGPWDALGVPAVENAGGTARAYAVQENGRVEERDPHDAFNWDILVLGSTAVNADILAGVVEQTYNTSG
jgi:fructose-1,6-bisphosphatase/inositol monophosphatase family enzyme